jgi:hypothetical protein
MHDTPTTLRISVWHNGVTHFVIDDVLDKPSRDKSSIEKRMYADHAILFLNRPKDDLVRRTLSTTLPPHDRVTAKPIAEVAVVQLSEDCLKVEIASGARGLALGKGELPLHGQRWMCDFAFLPGHLSLSN